jgi:integrase
LKGVSTLAGNVYKYETKSGEKRYMVMLEVGEGGKRKQKKKMGFKKKKDADAYLAEQQTALIKGNYVDPSKTQFKEFIMDWFVNIKEKSIPRTAYTYRILIEKYIIIHFEDLPLANLSGKHIDNFINKLHTFKYDKELKKTYSAATIRKVYNIVCSSLDYAVDNGLIAKNVARGATLPKEESKEMLVWDKDQVNRFLRLTQDERLFTLFYLALMTGMRQGELLGLRWKDIDLENHSLSVKQVLSHNGKEFHTGAKTKAGNRTITLSEDTVLKLKRHRKIQLEEKIQFGGEFNKHDLVFCSQAGTPMNPRNVNRRFDQLVEIHQMPSISFHGLRHTHATILLSQGVNVKVISERLGHSNIKITLQTYSHVLPTMQQEAAKKLDNLFGS